MAAEFSPLTTEIQDMYAYHVTGQWITDMLINKNLKAGTYKTLTIDDTTCTGWKWFECLGPGLKGKEELEKHLTVTHERKGLSKIDPDNLDIKSWNLLGTNIYYNRPGSKQAYQDAVYRVYEKGGYKINVPVDQFTYKVGSVNFDSSKAVTVPQLSKISAGRQASSVVDAFDSDTSETKTITLETQEKSTFSTKTTQGFKFGESVKTGVKLSAGLELKKIFKLGADLSREITNSSEISTSESETETTEAITKHSEKMSITAQAGTAKKAVILHDLETIRVPYDVNIDISGIMDLSDKFGNKWEVPASIIDPKYYGDGYKLESLIGNVSTPQGTIKAAGDWNIPNAISLSISGVAETKNVKNFRTKVFVITDRKLLDSGGIPLMRGQFEDSTSSRLSEALGSSLGGNQSLRKSSTKAVLSYLKYLDEMVSPDELNDLDSHGLLYEHSGAAAAVDTTDSSGIDQFGGDSNGSLSQGGEDNHAYLTDSDRDDIFIVGGNIASVHISDGDDYVKGSKSSDTVIAQASNSRKSSNTLFLGSGADLARIGKGRNFVSTGLGSDFIDLRLDGEKFSDYIELSKGSETISLRFKNSAKAENSFVVDGFSEVDAIIDASGRQRLSAKVNDFDVDIFAGKVRVGTLLNYVHNFDDLIYGDVQELSLLNAASIGVGSLKNSTLDFKNALIEASVFDKEIMKSNYLDVAGKSKDFGEFVEDYFDEFHGKAVWPEALDWISENKSKFKTAVGLLGALEDGFKSEEIAYS